MLPFPVIHELCLDLPLTPPLFGAEALAERTFQRDVRMLEEARGRVDHCCKQLDGHFAISRAIAVRLPKESTSSDH
jgi:hypothetical protein